MVSSSSEVPKLSSQTSQANAGGCGTMLVDKVAAIMDFDRVSERPRHPFATFMSPVNLTLPVMENLISCQACRKKFSDE